MSCLGVHFALAPEDYSRLLQVADDDAALLDLIQENIEERYLDSETKWQFQSDKAWDAIHRSLTNGRLEYGTGPYPLANAVLGGEPLYGGDDYIVVLVRPEHVAATAHALAAVTKEWLRQQYLAIDATDYGLTLSDDDFEYTWSNFEGLPEFFATAAAAGRPVVFTADQ